MKADVDRSTCTGCELCVQTCPAVFEIDGDGIARVKCTFVPAEFEQLCRTAAADCPVEAITIEK